MILKSAFQKLFKAREDASRARNKTAPGADDGFDPHEKPFLEHLEDLRKTMMQMLITLVIVTIFSFVFNKEIFEFVKWPLKNATIDEAGTLLWDVAKFVTLTPQEIFMLAIKTSFIVGFILAFPVLVYQLFQFILPGLRQVEKRMVIPGALIGFILFLIGASFAFFIATPIALKFFYGFEQERVGAIDPTAEAMERPIGETPLITLDGTEIPPIPKEKDETTSPEEENSTEEPITPNPLTPIEPETQEPDVPAPTETLDDETKREIREYMFQLLAFREGSEIALRYDDERDKIVIFKVKGKTTEYRIGDYITFLTRLVLVFGLSFQMPVVVTILVKLELLTARTMRNTRAYAWVIMMVASAIFTPPDVFTLGLLAGPMILLYELCIIIAAFMEKKRAKREAAEENERRERRERLYSRSADELSEDEKAELHRLEIERYEQEHAHLYEHENADHDHHDDPYHDEHGNPIEYDEHGHPIEHDGEHDESWHSDHHHGEEDHEPIQDWPDHGDEHSIADAESKPLTESDHVEPTELHETTDESETEDNDSDFDDDDVCEPTGPVVDLNHAEIEEIMDLPGMDEELAEMIIEHRPFGSFDEVEEVPGMSPEKLDEMIERLMLG